MKKVMEVMVVDLVARQLKFKLMHCCVVWDLGLYAYVFVVVGETWILNLEVGTWKYRM